MRLPLVIAMCATLAGGCTKAKDADREPANKGKSAPGTAKAAPAQPTDASAGTKAVKPGPAYLVFDSPDKALAHVLERKPVVLGIGEYHERTDVRGIVSTLARFAAMFEPLGARSSDFILETWVESGKCGKQEKVVSKAMQVQLKRPKTTESEMRKLLRKAQKLGVRPHVLTLECTDYASILDGKKQVDYAKMLSLVTRKLREKTLSVLSHRRAEAAKKKPAPKQLPTIIVYGGALHNDLHPYEGVDQWSYVKDVDQAADGGYVELDLYVPEYIEGKKLLQTEDWFPVYRRLAAKDKVLLFPRSDSSYIMVMRKGLAKPAK